MPDDRALRYARAAEVARIRARDEASAQARPRTCAQCGAVITNIMHLFCRPSCRDAYLAAQAGAEASQ